jgi:hypothetical protein
LKIYNVILKAYLVLAKALSNNLYKQVKLLLLLDIVNKESKYKVKQILSNCLVQGKRKYLVWFKGYSPKDNYEYNTKGLKHCKDLLEEY